MKPLYLVAALVGALVVSAAGVGIVLVYGAGPAPAPPPVTVTAGDQRAAPDLARVGKKGVVDPAASDASFTSVQQSRPAGKKGVVDPAASDASFTSVEQSRPAGKKGNP